MSDIVAQDAPPPVLADNETERREYWRKVVHEDLRICARDNGLILDNQVLANLPLGIASIAGILASEITDRALRKHEKRPDLEIQIRRDIRASAWNAMRIHRGSAPSRAPSGATHSQGKTNGNSTDR